MLGGNVPAIGGYHTSFKVADEWTCECLQIYISPSRRWNVPTLRGEEITKFKKAWKKSQVKEVVAHIPYLVNLASPEEGLWDKSIERLKTELSRADELGVSLLVLHPGSHTTSTKEEGLERIILGMSKVLDRYNGKARILLETMAGQGTMIGSNFEEIAGILKKVKYKKSLGVCLDIGHLFMAGYEVRTANGYEKVLSHFDKTIGIDKIGVIHINDSKSKFGSRIDRHSPIGEGEMGLEVFRSIVRDKRFANIPKILEVPDAETKTIPNLKLLRSYKESRNKIQ